ncbi:MAG TPA: hypothetical protein VGB53_00855 [Rubricoccaceae bacterium]|jgi:hypothetical protein
MSPTSNKTITITNRAALTAGGALGAAMKPRDGKTPLPTKVLWALMANQQALAAAAEKFSAAQQELQSEHTKVENGEPVRQTQTEREITGEGATRKEVVREVSTGVPVLIDEAAFARAMYELGEETIDLTVRQVPLSALLDAGWEPAGLWPLVDIVLVEDDA